MEAAMDGLLAGAAGVIENRDEIPSFHRPARSRGSWKLRESVPIAARSARNGAGVHSLARLNGIPAAEERGYSPMIWDQGSRRTNWTFSSISTCVALSPRRRRR